MCRLQPRALVNSSNSRQGCGLGETMLNRTVLAVTVVGWRARIDRKPSRILHQLQLTLGEPGLDKTWFCMVRILIQRLTTVDPPTSIKDSTRCSRVAGY